MTKDEALTLALETLEISLVFVMSHEMIKQPEGADWYDNRITAIKEALAQLEQEPVALAQEVIGCFHAAKIEGLTEALANTSDLHLKDLVERRLMHALYAAQEGEGSK